MAVDLNRDPVHRGEPDQALSHDSGTYNFQSVLDDKNKYDPKLEMIGMPFKALNYNPTCNLLPESQSLSVKSVSKIGRASCRERVLYTV